MSIRRTPPGPDLERIRARAQTCMHSRQALVGRLADLRRATRGSPPRSGPGRAGGCGSNRRHAPARTSRRFSTSRGRAGNMWLGLALLHALFMLEHNAICDRFAPRVPHLVRRSAVRQGPADQRGADGKDPHPRSGPRRSSPSPRRRFAMRATGGASSASGCGRRFGRLG